MRESKEKAPRNIATALCTDQKLEVVNSTHLESY